LEFRKFAKIVAVHVVLQSSAVESVALVAIATCAIEIQKLMVNGAPDLIGCFVGNLYVLSGILTFSHHGKPVTKTILIYKMLIINYLRVWQFGLASGMLQFKT
jgi:hypothetical protein